MVYNRAEMKREVKRIMKQTRPRPIWVTLLYLVIVAAGGWVIRTVIGSIIGVGALANNFAGMAGDLGTFYDFEMIMESIVTYLLKNISIISGLITGGILIGILNYLWQSLMGVSYVGYSLAMVRGDNPDVKKLFSGFPKFGSVILTRILVGVFTFLWTLLFVIGFAVVAVIAGLLIEWTAVGVVLMIVGYVLLIWGILWATLRYAMTDYLLMDQGLSGLEAIRVSKQIMKGNKGKFFVLQLSFIGWYLLEVLIIYVCAFAMVLCAALVAAGAMGGIIIAVILMLVMLAVMAVAILLFNMWLTPYMSGATAKFYEYTLGQRPDLFVRQFDTYTDDSFGNPNYPKLD